MHEAPDAPAISSFETAFRLGPLTLDPRTGEATGPGGVEKLDPKVMGVLVMLAQNAGQIVLRADLLERLWPGVIVSDEALSRCIYELRRQLSQAAGGDQFKDAIETLPKRGYRLRIDVTPISPEVAAQPFWRRPAPIIAGALAIVVAVLVALWQLEPPDKPTQAGDAFSSIAVLPFVDMSPGKDQAYLADGISEEILNRLAQAENLRVIARTSSFALRDPALDVAEIARRLNVTHVLEGSVRKSGDRIRITTQLIAASNSSHVWSDTFDSDFGDLFAVQDEIATAVTAALAIRLSDSPAPPRPTSNFEAHEKFLQGEFFYYRRAPGDFERAVANYETAVALDPGYARAWASLSMGYSMLARQTHPPIESLLEKQGEAAKRAVELNPKLAFAQIRLGLYYKAIGERGPAEEHFRIAKALDPEDPYFLTQSVEDALNRGDIPTAIGIQQRMVARDPLAAVVRGDLAVFLLADGRLEEALAQFRSVQAIHPNTDPNVAIDIVHVLILQGRHGEAEVAMALVPEGNQRDQGQALLYAATKRDAQADDALRRMTGGPQGFMDTVRLAEVYAFRGMADQAFAVLDAKKQALARKYGARSAEIWYLQFESKLSPFLKALHSDPRWSTFVASLS